MSHIDEALRRAIGIAVEQRDRADQFKLDEYPKESPSAPDYVAPVRPPFELRTPEAPARPAEPAFEDEVAKVVARDETPVRRQTRASTPSVVRSLPPTSRVDGESLGDAPPGLMRQYRRIAEALRQANAERHVRTMTITSAAGEEGKAQTAVNLALTVAKTMGTRGLLIDADVTSPLIHELVGTPNGIGLCDLLHTGRSDVPLVEVTSQLRLLTVGMIGTDALGDLTSERMRALLHDAASQYDWLIVNAPAMSAGSAVSSLVRFTQSVLFVVGAGTPFPVVEKAIAEIGRESMLGTVLTGLDSALDLGGIGQERKTS